MERELINRELGVVIKEAFEYFAVITVTGPRQSGKTTLIRSLFPNMPYFSFESPDVRSYAENDPIAFLNQGAEGMVLDEVRNCPKLAVVYSGHCGRKPEAPVYPVGELTIRNAEKGDAVIGRSVGSV